MILSSNLDSDKSRVIPAHSPLRETAKFGKATKFSNKLHTNNSSNLADTDLKSADNRSKWEMGREQKNQNLGKKLSFPNLKKESNDPKELESAQFVLEMRRERLISFGNEKEFPKKARSRNGKRRKSRKISRQTSRQNINKNTKEKLIKNLNKKQREMIKKPSLTEIINKVKEEFKQSNGFKKGKYASRKNRSMIRRRSTIDKIDIKGNQNQNTAEFLLTGGFKNMKPVMPRRGRSASKRAKRAHSTRNTNVELDADFMRMLDNQPKKGSKKSFEIPKTSIQFGRATFSQREIGKMKERSKGNICKLSFNATFGFDPMKRPNLGIRKGSCYENRSDKIIKNRPLNLKANLTRKNDSSFKRKNNSEQNFGLMESNFQSSGTESVSPLKGSEIFNFQKSSENNFNKNCETNSTTNSNTKQRNLNKFIIKTNPIIFSANVSTPSCASAQLQKQNAQKWNQESQEQNKKNLQKKNF